MIYSLMNKDRIALVLDCDDTHVEVIDRKLLPFELVEVTTTNLSSFEGIKKASSDIDAIGKYLKERVLRAIEQNLVPRDVCSMVPIVDMHMREVANILLSFHGVLLQDDFWLKKDGESISYEYVEVSYTFRNANEEDRKQLENLLSTCFGEFPMEMGALDFIENKYRVAEYKGKIVAMSGILPIGKTRYAGYEVAWTCTHPLHRKRGLVLNILRQLESELPNDHLSIYCDCWRVGNDKDSSMAPMMKRLEMELIIRENQKLLSPHRKECLSCIHRKDNCICHNDLYYKRR